MKIVIGNVSKIIVPLSSMYTQFEEYDCKTDDFEIRKERLSMYFVINNTVVEKKVPILITLLENENYALLKNLVITKKPAGM